MGRTWAHMFNMFIMPKYLADEYCSWVFPVLKTIENINTGRVNQFQKRYVGAVSEMMLDVWIERQTEAGRVKQEDITELPHIYTRKINWPRKATSFLLAKFFGVRYTKSF